MSTEPTREPAAGQEQPTALVTGSSNGIGEAIVKELAKLDYRLVVTGRSAADVSRVAEECAKLSPSQTKPLEIVADLEREQDVDRLLEESMQHFRGKLSLLVNNAGYGQPVPHSQPEACYEAFKRIHQINLNALAKLTLKAAPALKQEAERRGTPTSIVNIGSIAGFRPGSALAAYSTSKAAVNMFTTCMAVELAPQIRVNCISPGPIVTKIIERSGFSLDAFRAASEACAPLGRVGEAPEVARAVLFLADPQQAGYITGANLAIDGGMLSAPMHFQ